MTTTPRGGVGSTRRPRPVAGLSAIAARAGGEARVCGVSDGLEVTQPTVSHHLKVLREAGLVPSERRASSVYYRVIPEADRGTAADVLRDHAG